MLRLHQGQFSSSSTAFEERCAPTPSVPTRGGYLYVISPTACGPDVGPRDVRSPLSSRSVTALATLRLRSEAPRPHSRWIVDDGYRWTGRPPRYSAAWASPDRGVLRLVDRGPRRGQAPSAFERDDGEFDGSKQVWDRARSNPVLQGRTDAELIPR